MWAKEQSCCPVPASESSAQSYATDTGLLTQGRYSIYAIALLEYAKRLDPKNSDYHVAPGCPYIDQEAVKHKAKVEKNPLVRSDFALVQPKLQIVDR
jgi:hypothetical protein